MKAYKQLIVSTFLYAILVAVIGLKITAFICFTLNMLFVIIGAILKPHKVDELADRLSTKFYTKNLAHSTIFFILLESIAGVLIIYATPLGLRDLIFKRED